MHDRSSWRRLASAVCSFEKLLLGSEGRRIESRDPGRYLQLVVNLTSADPAVQNGRTRQYDSSVSARRQNLVSTTKTLGPQHILSRVPFTMYFTNGLRLAMIDHGDHQLHTH